MSVNVTLLPRTPKTPIPLTALARAVTPLNEGMLFKLSPSWIAAQPPERVIVQFVKTAALSGNFIPAPSASRISTFVNVGDAFIRYIAAAGCHPCQPEATWPEYLIFT